MIRLLYSFGKNLALTDLLFSTGVSSFTGAIDANGDLDVDGHTELDNVSVSGVSTIFKANGSDLLLEILVVVELILDLSLMLIIGANSTL